MPIADDVTTGPTPPKQPTRSAPTRSAPTVTPPAATSTSTSTSTSTPKLGVATNPFAPDLRTDYVQKAMDELAMRSGATTTVPEVEGWQGLGNLTSAASGQTTRDLLGEASDLGLHGQAAALFAASGVQGIQQGRRTAPGAPSADETTAADKAREARTQSLALGGAKRGSKVLGAEGYKDLNPDQKAAVDLNTLLSKAVKDDRRTRRSGEADPDATYDEAVENVFGDDGKTKYAPATVTLLNSIGFKAEDLDLDDFLKLKVGVTSSELGSFSLDEERGGGAASLVTPEATRTSLQKGLVEAFRNTRTDQVNGENLLGLQRALLGTDRKLGFGRADSRVEAPMDAQVTDYFQRSLTALAQPTYAADKDAIVKDIRDHLTDGEWQAFINFLDVSSRDAMQYRRPLMEGTDATSGEPLEFMLPRDFRKHMGF